VPATHAARARLRTGLPLLAVGAAAWAALALRSPHAGHVPAMGRTPGALAGQAVLMFGAMMVPLAGAPVRHVLDRSLARRRVRAAALFTAAYGLAWTGATVALLLAAGWMAGARSLTVPAMATLAVAAWQCSPAKQHALNRCHGRPQLAAFGASADGDVLRFGLSHAGWCIASCGPLMLLPMLLGRGHLAAMAAVTLWVAGERFEAPAAPRWRVRGPGHAVRIAGARTQAWWRRASAAVGAVRARVDARPGEAFG
jgi:predicted metal-binding membrane protein